MRLVVLLTAPQVQPDGPAVDLGLCSLHVDAIEQWIVDQVEEILLAQAQHLAILQHRHRGIPRAVRQQGFLAEGIARPQCRKFAGTLAIAGIAPYHCATPGQHVIVITRITLPDQVFTGGDLNLLDTHHHTLDIGRRHLLQNAGLQQHTHPVVFRGIVEVRDLVIDGLGARQCVTQQPAVDARDPHV